MPPPQDYLIFHPERKGYDAAGDAVVGGVLRSGWTGTVWTDPWRRAAQSNEDPYVWGPDWWLYSYCHASQLCRVASASQSTTREGSRLFFCETRAAKIGLLRVDTVFVVSDQAAWVRPGVSVPARFASLQIAGAGPYWDRHLRHGVPHHPINANRNSHGGLYTYVANLGGDSYLPIGEDDQPTCVSISTLLPGREVDLNRSLPANQQTRPLKLTPLEATDINFALVNASKVRVVKLSCARPTALPARKLPPIK